MTASAPGPLSGFRPPPTGAWRAAMKPNIDRFDLAAKLDLTAAWNAEGARAMAELLKHICGAMDDGVAAVAYARALDAGLAPILRAADGAIEAHAGQDPVRLDAAMCDLGAALQAFRHFAQNVSSEEALALAVQALHEEAQG